MERLDLLAIEQVSNYLKQAIEPLHLIKDRIENSSQPPESIEISLALLEDAGQKLKAADTWMDTLKEKNKN